MSEEVKKEEEKSEGVILNWWEEDKTFTLAEVEQIKKDMQSDSEKWVQKLITWNKAYKTAMKELSNISDNPESLVDLFWTNEEAGQIILDEYYDWISIEEFKTQIEYEADYTDPEVIEKLIEKGVTKRESEKAFAKAMKETLEEKEKFIKELDITWDELKKFEEEFEDRKALKSFWKTSIRNQLNKAYLDSTADEQWARDKLKHSQQIAKELWTGWWKGSWDKKSSKEITQEKRSSEISDFLKTHNI